MKEQQGERTVLINDLEGGCARVKIKANNHTSFIISKAAETKTNSYKRYDSIKSRTIKLKFCNQE
jgi:hypothetical protein